MSHPTTTTTRMSHHPPAGAPSMRSNYLKRRRFLLPVPLASGLLWAVVMGGCLVPQDYRFSDDPPPFKNNPVTIVSPPFPEGTTLTANNGQGGPTATACRLSFRISASDPDLDDLLTVRWYVDYDRNPVIFREDLLQNLGSPIRGPAELTMDLGVPGNPLSSQGIHVLEVLVADGQVVNRQPLPRSSDPDAGENPTYMDEHAWIVRTETGDCP